MERKIKFEYGFQSVNGIVKKHYHLHEIPSIKEKCDVWNVLPICYVREFTGLHDKNGVEIYDGDAYKAHNNDTIYFVYKKSGVFCGGENFKKSTPIGFEVDKYGEIIEDSNWVSEEVEVIGNIYQNPDLLK